MLTARHKILAHLRKNRLVSAREVARALKMSAPNVRHHLGLLVEDGRAEVVAVRRRAGKGRPEKVYSIARAALGDNLAGLADALLAEAGASIAMDALGRRLAGAAPFADGGGLPVSRRLVATLEKLNNAHYMARWEAGAEGPHVILGMCPYAAIIEKHPELCRMDTALLSALLGQEVSQKTKLAPACVFVVK